MQAQYIEAFGEKRNCLFMEEWKQETAYHDKRSGKTYKWLTDYKVGQPWRYTPDGVDSTNFVLGSENTGRSTQVWLMGDGTYDAYAKIRNQVRPHDQNVNPLNMISMVSNDIQTVSIPGLS